MEGHSIPYEIMEHDYNERACLKVRDLASKLPFGYKKAVRAAKDAIKERTLFWDKIYVLYPEFKGKRLVYKTEIKRVCLYEEKE